MQKSIGDERVELRPSPAFRRFLELAGVNSPLASTLLKSKGRRVQHATEFGRIDVFLQPDSDHIVCVTVTPPDGRARPPNTDAECKQIVRFLQELAQGRAA